MALTKKSWQDHLLASFGQESETARTEKDGLTVGGVYNATPPTIADGEFSRLQVDASGNLMVNLVSGDAVTVSVGTITTGSLTNIAKVHNAGTLAGGDLGSVAAVGVIHSAGTVAQLPDLPGGTIDSVTAVAGLPNLITSYKGTIQIPTSDTVTTGTEAATQNGLVRHLTLVTPDMEDTDSTKIELINSSGAAVFTSGTKAESATTGINLYGTWCPVDSTMEWVVTAEGTQSGNRDIVFEIAYQQI